MKRSLCYLLFIFLLSCEHPKNGDLVFIARKSFVNLFQNDSLNSVMNPFPKVIFELKVINNSSLKQKIKIAENIEGFGNFYLVYTLSGENDTLYNTSYQNFKSLDVLPNDSLGFDLVFSLSNRTELKDPSNMYRIANEGLLFYRIGKKDYEISKAEGFEVVYRDSNELGIE